MLKVYSQEVLQDTSFFFSKYMIQVQGTCSVPIQVMLAFVLNDVD